MSAEMDSVEAMRKRIRATTDVIEKAGIAGLIRKPFSDVETTQSCATCIYFLPNHAHCDLPELNFPVDHDWWCRLWRL